MFDPLQPAEIWKKWSKIKIVPPFVHKKDRQSSEKPWQKEASRTMFNQFCSISAHKMENMGEVANVTYCEHISYTFMYD